MRQFLGLCCCLVTGLVAAEVVDVSPQGFVSKHELVLVASPEAGYRALVEEVDQWWDASHSFAGDASAFRIDDVAGGCFCEINGDTEVVHLTVVNVSRGKSITFRGGLGPLQAMAVTGAMTFAFAEHEQGSTLKYSYSVGGYIPGGLDQLANAVDQVQLGQLLRLQKFLAERAGSELGQ